MFKLQKGAGTLAVIVSAALAVRIAFLLSYQADRPHRALGAIPFLFEPGNIAYSIATGHGFGSPFRVETGPTAWITPVYPLFLACIFHLFGNYSYAAFVAAASANILFSALTCIPIWYTGKRVAGPLVGASAASLWAIFPNAFIIPVESMWDSSLTTLLAAVILAFTLALSEESSVRKWCGYGLLWGFALMTNATLLALFPLLAGWIAYALHRRNRQWRIGLVFATATVVFCCVPWTLRNAMIFHTFIPLRSALGLQLWVGNNEHSLDRSPGALHPIGNSDERSSYIALGEVEYMRRKEDEAIRFMLSHTALEARLTTSRFVAVWTGGTEHPIRDLVHVHSAWFRFVILFNVLAAAGALGGIIVLFWRRSPFALPIAVYPIVFPLAYYLTLTSPRYRMPIDPAVLLLASTALLHRKIEVSWTPRLTQ